MIYAAYFVRAAVCVIFAAIILMISAAVQAQLFHPAVLAVAETVFGNVNQPWPFTNQVYAIAYNNGGKGIGYNTVQRTDQPLCQVNGSSYRADYINFKVASWPSVPSMPYWLCGDDAAAGEWHDYIISVSGAGPFTITLWDVNFNAGAVWTVSIDNVAVTTVTLPGSSDFTTVLSATSGAFNVSPGTHVLRITATSGDPVAGYVGDFVAWQGALASQGNTYACDVGPNYVGTLPTAVANANFTHCFVNLDFTNTSFKLANSMNCFGASGTNVLMYEISGLDCSTHFDIESDSTSGGGYTGTLNALHAKYLPSDYPTSPFNAIGWSSMASLGNNTDCTVNGGGAGFTQGRCQGAAYYIEVVGRSTAASISGNPNSNTIGPDVWSTTVYNQTGGADELDVVEPTVNNGGGCFNVSDHQQVLVWDGGSSIFGGTGINGLCYDHTVYNKIAMFATADPNGSGQYWFCTYLNNSGLGCTRIDNFFSAPDWTDQLFSGYNSTCGAGNNGGAPTAQNDCFYRRITIFTCQGFAQNTTAGLCYGPVVTSQ